MTTEITITTETALLYPLHIKEVEKKAAAVLHVLGLESKELEIALVDDRVMSRIHKAAFGAVGPTNTLAFPAQNDARKNFLGEIVLSVDTLKRECHLYAQEYTTYLIRLLTHAVLHLTGMAHGPEMDALTDQVVEAVISR